MRTDEDYQKGIFTAHIKKHGASKGEPVFLMRKELLNY
jgi:hypothetical protein